MSRTHVLKVDPSALNSLESRSSLDLAAAILRGGGTVAFPTETVYGLGANALDPGAVAKIFDAKQRPAWDPLIVHVAHPKLLLALTREITPMEQLLINSFWPGPLTLLVPRGSAVPDAVTAGRDKVGVRMPLHSVARAMLDRAGIPIAAPSANSFGRISPTTAQHVLEDLDGRIDAILDGGPTTLGLESTVLDARAKPPIIYRPGMISLEELCQKLPDIVLYRESGGLEEATPEALPSPGVGIRHYAPRATLLLVDPQDLQRSLSQALSQSHGAIGILLPSDWPEPWTLGVDDNRVRIFPWGNWDDPGQLAQRLFLGLRELDRQGVENILCPIPPHAGIGAALRDRLEKAARK